jgi:hypothetical protein
MPYEDDGLAVRTSRRRSKRAVFLDAWEISPEEPVLSITPAYEPRIRLLKELAAPKHNGTHTRAPL